MPHLDVFDKVDLIISHMPCTDGLCAAWVVKKVFPDAEFVPANYGQKPPDVKGRHVVITDFSYPRDVLLKMHEEVHSTGGSLLVLDHHQTAQKNLEGLDNFCVFDMKRSGAGLAYDYFQPDIAKDLVNYVQDRDLWTWALPHSKEISATIASYPLTFESLDYLHKVMCQRPETLVDEGTAILRYQDKLVDQLCESKRLVKWPVGSGGEVVEVHAVNTAVLQSEVANKISEGRLFGVAWYQNQEGLYCYSLRNKEENTFDTTTAVRPNGGGHRHASGLRSKDRLI